MKNRVLALGLAAAMVFGTLTGCALKTAETTPEAPTAEEKTEGEAEAKTEGDIGYDKVVIGLDDTFAPMGFRDENNELVGFDVELAKAVGEIIGVEVEFQPIEWAMKETELTNKNIDLIWNGYTITDARKEKVLFTQPYLKNRQIVLVPGDSDIETLADLKGKTVATQAQSSSEEAITANPEIKNTFGEYVTFGTYEECLLDMEAGRADAVVADEVLIRYYISQHEGTEYKVLDENFGEEEYGIGARKEDTALVEAINGALTEIKNNGTGKEISEKWFAEDILQ
ncbi:MAG TPA: amino acid ABC transporter substrate-binding protein [Lachnospiraceae bacterium]|nr:amino acid ABC transporter substrate-binding protein [Lachnospiraceae bacterium]